MFTVQGSVVKVKSSYLKKQSQFCRRRINVNVYKTKNNIKNYAKGVKKSKANPQGLSMPTRNRRTSQSQYYSSALVVQSSASWFCHSRENGNPVFLQLWIPHQVRNDKPGSIFERTRFEKTKPIFEMLNQRKLRIERNLW